MGAFLFEPTRGLEPLTLALQVRCATNCARSASHFRDLEDGFTRIPIFYLSS